MRQCSGCEYRMKRQALLQKWGLVREAVKAEKKGRMGVSYSVQNGDCCAGAGWGEDNLKRLQG